MRRLLPPIVGMGFVLTTATVLILVMIIRPWGGNDRGWRTHLNLTDEALDHYSRSVQTFVGPDAPIEVWHLSASADGKERAFYVGHGCAFCHGIEGQGGVSAPAFEEFTRSDIVKALRKGPEGMPPLAGAAAVLSDEDVDAIVAYVREIQGGGASKAVAPAPTPVPAPAVQATLTPGPTSVAIQPTAPIPTPQPTTTGTPQPSPGEGGPVKVDAVVATMTVDGDTSDWSGIPATSVTLQQTKPIPGVERGEVEPIDVDLRVAVDSEKVYVLVEVHDDYDYVADDHGLSAAMAVMFRIDDPAAPHMGATEEDQRRSLGKVDIWHWELDCGPGVVSGGVTGIRGGNDPACNLDDEYAKTPKDLEDDGSTQAENSLAGAWDHTARAQGAGADGAWIFELSRRLQTGDPDDAQLSAGTTANMALAYWDADETPDGWTDAGHLQSASGGWIEVNLP